MDKSGENKFGTTNEQISMKSTNIHRENFQLVSCQIKLALNIMYVMLENGMFGRNSSY